MLPSVLRPALVTGGGWRPMAVILARKKHLSLVRNDRRGAGRGGAETGPGS